MLLAAALVVGLVFLGISQSGVAPKIEAAICSLFGGDCEAPAEESIPDSALPSCEVTTSSYSGGGEVTVFSVNLGGDVDMTLKKIQKPDGSTEYQVEQTGGLDAGAHVMFGAKGKFGLGEGLSAEAKKAIAAKGGATWSFGSEDEARDFMKESAKEYAKHGVAGRFGPAKGLAKWGMDRVTGGAYDIPQPDEYYVDVGTKTSANLTAAAGPEATLGGGNTHALGIKYKPAKDGQPAEQTVFYKGSRELSAQLGFAGVGPGGDGKVETVVGITFRDGEPVAASVDAAGELDYRLMTSASTGEVPLGKSLPAGSGNLGIDTKDSVSGKVSLNLDLTNQDNKDAFADVLQSTGMPLLPSSGTPGYQDPVTAVAGLTKRFSEGGPDGGATMTTQVFDGSSEEFNVGFFAGDLITFGAGGKVATSRTHATDAYYYDPAAGGMTRWHRCAGDS